MSSVLRSIERGRAKQIMKNAGATKFCKHDYNNTVRLNGKPGDRMRVGSTFAERWREFSPKGVNLKVNTIKKEERNEVKN